MQLFSSSSASSSSTSSRASFSPFTSPQDTNQKYIKYRSKFSFKIPTKNLPIPSSSKQSSPVLDQRPLFSESESTPRNRATERSIKSEKDSFEGLLVARRPVVEISGSEDSTQGSDNNVDDSKKKSSAIIDAGLEEFAKKMPIFEPERVEAAGSSQGKPLTVNLDLALYKAKVLARNYRYAEAQEILEKCISYWPEDGRPYVALGKILNKQSKTAEARAVYEKGCQATHGENAYIWQEFQFGAECMECWAVLENKMGNIRRARELFDAATVADKRHTAAWHGWAVLELKQGNVKKARQLLAKGLKFSGGNEYIYQTLALLEAKANRYEQARYLFRQATKCNPRSCASWLAWAQLEMRQENNLAARQLFEKAVQASPKNRFAWHVWGVFEYNMGNIEVARKLLKIGHSLNPRDPVLLQSLALLEYKHSTANLARVLFRKASELDPRHQPVWIAWGWMEWKEGNISTARELYQRALSIDSTSESAARCLQRTEVVDDASWVMGFLDIIDPAIDSVKKLLNLDPNRYSKTQESLRNISGERESSSDGPSSDNDADGIKNGTGFDLNSFIKVRLSLDPTKLDIKLETSGPPAPWRASQRRLWRSKKRTTAEV
ncbi:protein high chlorophyll fluorescent 107 isoform X3 [Manihot esculenta]|uniref:protein high chlorophyll fluorescent 107 isoform X3 n=1 Tax=Manihot esculenta TaxID=3983 RepID=UPI001CC6907C|nr:protein high chlorophyll fluorescent 107 isoform X3 [Manihot esculenta]